MMMRNDGKEVTQWGKQTKPGDEANGQVGLEIR